MILKYRTEYNPIERRIAHLFSDFLERQDQFLKTLYGLQGEE